MSDSTAPAVGQRAPGLGIPDCTGRTRELDEMVRSRPLVLLFYRGSTSPACLRQLADFGRRIADFNARGFNLAALSSDDGERSEDLRDQLDLRYPVLCDTSRTVARAWGLLDGAPAVDAARPALFVVGQDFTILHRSLDDTLRRPLAADVLAALDGAATVRRRLLLPRVRDLLAALSNVLRRRRES